MFKQKRVENVSVQTTRSKTMPHSVIEASHQVLLGLMSSLSFDCFSSFLSFCMVPMTTTTSFGLSALIVTVHALLLCPPQ